MYIRYSFDTLINFVKHGEIPLIRQIGNPDDSAAVIIRDTIMIPARDSLFNAAYPVDSLRYVPFGEGAEFKMESGEVERGNVRLKVFEVVDTRPFDPNKVLRVGSLTEPSNAGNWE